MQSRTPRRAAELHPFPLDPNSPIDPAPIRHVQVLSELSSVQICLVFDRLRNQSSPHHLADNHVIGADFHADSPPPPLCLLAVEPNNWTASVLINF
ncbi:hypothetical protein J6590_033937 [Homalodisca vitripennis]|nr:hypothetical protein J6590_033937 [Homalodisca vitripennis]